MEETAIAQEQGAEPYKVGPGRPPLESRFPPGVSGNPGGRPRGSSVVAPWLRKLAANPNEHGEGAEAEAVADKMIADFKAGDFDSVTAGLKIMERTDGLMTQKIETEKRKRIVLDLGDAPAKPKESA